MLATFYREPGVLNNDFFCDTVPLQVNCVCGQRFPGGCSGNSVRKDYYLFYVREGTVSLQKPLQAILGVGDMILFEPSVPFSYIGNGATVHYGAHFTGALASEFLKLCAIRTNTVYSVGHPEQVDSLFRTLFQAFLRRDALFDLDSACKLTELLTELGRLLQAKNETVSDARKLEASLFYIHTNFSSSISVGELAQIEHLSESRYRTVFGAVMGQSPLSYLTELRMQTACDLLRRSSLGIGQVAEAVGYPDGRYFARLFRKQYGMTPGEYRRNFSFF